MMLLFFWVHAPLHAPTVREKIIDRWFILGRLLNDWIFTWIAVGSIIALKSAFWFLNEILSESTLKTLMLSNNYLDTMTRSITLPLVV